ncbi:hypothetical protein, partial [Flavobacterium psychrophilum]|uniref:hypothetical protein n=1 Tax=Flavobacterium psychrophilum TaxID=96345 RepID=UPI001C5331CB
MATYIGLMVQISAEYLSIKRKRTNRFFIQRKNPSMPLTFHSKINIRIRLQFELFFLERMLTEYRQSEWRFCGILSEKNCILWGLGKWKISPTEL